MTSADLAIWEDNAEALERHLQQIETRAWDTLVELGFARGTDVRGTFDSLSYTQPDPGDLKGLRDHERARAACTVLLRLQDLRRHIQPQSASAYDVLRIIQAALEVGTMADDAVLDRWLAHEYRAGQVARARALSKLKHEQHDRELEQLKTELARLRADHPRATSTTLARMLDPEHTERTRKRIQRIDLLQWEARLQTLRPPTRTKKH